MSRASVFNWDTGVYSYYTLPGKDDLGGWEKLGGLGISGPQRLGVGIDIEDALPKLPSSAKFVGQGRDAVGTVMVLPTAGGLGGLGTMPNPWALLAIGVLGAAWMWFKHE